MKEIPKPEGYFNEVDAGVQPDMLTGAEQDVIIHGKGEIRQASMDDWLKVEQMREEQENVL